MQFIFDKITIKHMRIQIFNAEMWIENKQLRYVWAFPSEHQSIFQLFDCINIFQNINNHGRVYLTKESSKFLQN